MSNTSNKYKEPSTTATFRAKYNDNSNPEENWIKSEHLFLTPRKEDPEGVGMPFNVGKVRVGAKSAQEMMQDMLRGVTHKQQVNAYYSLDAQDRLGGLLTNPYKRNAYTTQLQAQLPQLPQSTAKNYQLLMLLLQEVGKNEVQVRSGREGLKIGFNQKVLDHQELLLERLRKEKDARQAEERRIINQYEQIVGDLQKITERLASCPESTANSPK